MSEKNQLKSKKSHPQHKISNVLYKTKPQKGSLPKLKEVKSFHRP